MKANGNSGDSQIDEVYQVKKEDVMTERATNQGKSLGPTRREFLGVTGASVALIATGCKETTPPVPAKSDAVNALDDLTKYHRAFLALWLFLTTNANWVNLCPPQDFDKLSTDLGGLLPPATIKAVYDLLKNDSKLSSLVTNAGMAFNDSRIKALSRYTANDSPLYSGKTCPVSFSDVLNVFNPGGTFTVPAPTC